MAIIKCKECKTEISSKAETCPKCGIKIKKPMGCGSFLTILFGLFFVFLVIGLNTENKSYNTDTTVADPTPSVSIPEPEILGSQWEYRHSDDKMSKEGTIYQGIVISSNTVNFKFPYSGAQHAALTLRTHPRHGKDIIFRIEKGQILCHSFDDDCSVLVRFDDKDPVKYSASAASDNSTETVFIDNYDRFVGNMLKAKQVRIAPEIYQEGTPVFEFDVSGFDPDKYRLQSKKEKSAK